MICLLLDLGWQPTGPWDWTSDEGERFYISDKAWELDLDWGPFKQSFNASLERALWARASLHFCGGGLQKGTDLTSVKAQLRRLQQRDDKRHWYGAVRTSVTGAQWPRKRLQEAGISIDTALCQRCGEAEETKFHRCWGCKANEAIPACAKTAHLARRAERDVGVLPCLWLRGLVPAAWMEVTPPPEDPSPFVSGASPSSAWLWEGRLVGAGDGSGGAHTSDRRLRRAGWAVTIATARAGLGTCGKANEKRP